MQQSKSFDIQSSEFAAYRTKMAKQRAIDKQLLISGVSSIEVGECKSPTEVAGSHVLTSASTSTIPLAVTRRKSYATLIVINVIKWFKKVVGGRRVEYKLDLVANKCNPIPPCPKVQLPT